MNDIQVEPIETSDPELARLLNWWCNTGYKKHKTRIDDTPELIPSRASVIPGRNDPCMCGSGKKYKKCCGNN